MPIDIFAAADDATLLRHVYAALAIRCQRYVYAEALLLLLR